jgi:hypothetical protein
MDEAVGYVDAAGESWKESPGAIEWLEEMLEAARKKSRKAKAPGSKKKGR